MAALAAAAGAGRGQAGRLRQVPHRLRLLLLAGRTGLVLQLRGRTLLLQRVLRLMVRVWVVLWLRRGVQDLLLLLLAHGMEGLRLHGAEGGGWGGVLLLVPRRQLVKVQGLPRVYQRYFLLLLRPLLVLLVMVLLLLVCRCRYLGP